MLTQALVTFNSTYILHLDFANTVCKFLKLLSQDLLELHELRIEENFQLILGLIDSK
jgi:hypothetical protein